MKQPTMADRQRKFREKHKPEVPPLIGVWLRGGDCACLAAGVVPASVQIMARDAMVEFYGEEQTAEELARVDGSTLLVGTGSTAASNRR